MIYSVHDLASIGDPQREYAPNVWAAARPNAIRGRRVDTAPLLLRLVVAWRVFTGRYDALDWDASTSRSARPEGEGTS